MKPHKSSVRLSDADEAAEMIGGIRTNKAETRHEDWKAHGCADFQTDSQAQAMEHM